MNARPRDTTQGRRAGRLAGLAALFVLLCLVGLGCNDGGDGGGANPGPSTERPAPRSDPRSARFKLTVGDLIPLSGELKPFGPPGRKAADPDPTYVGVHQRVLRLLDGQVGGL